jgi:hypothetical protein
MESSRKFHKLSIVATNGFHLVECLMSLLDNDELELAVSIARHIWLRYNSFLFRREFIPPAQLAQQGVDAMKLFRQSISISSSQQGVSGSLRQSQWVKPSSGMLKANWDVAIDLQSKRMGVIAIIRNDEGFVMAAMCTFVPFITDPAIAEAVGL